MSSSQSDAETKPSRDALDRLRDCIAGELAEEVLPGIAWLAARIAERHAPSDADAPHPVLGVLFYGSSLRKQTDEGVLDYWVVVDDDLPAFNSFEVSGLTRGLLGFVSRIAPPTVFYLEDDFEGRPLRTKYGVIRQSDFERGTTLRAWHPYVWARFAQPARLIQARDGDARESIERAVTESVITMVGRLVCFLPVRGEELRFRLPAFWQEAFQRTYDSERRPEAEESIRGLYLANESRYDDVANWAVRVLTERGHFQAATEHPRALQIQLSTTRRAMGQMRWRAMRPYARFLGLVRLFKTAWTFGDWVPYVLWKLERHTGRKIELTDRQRRHPLIFAWPIILPLLLKRNLR